jgi:hypothetical protein
MTSIEHLLMGVPTSEVIPEAVARWMLDACDALRQFQNPSPGLMASMALRLDHRFGMYPAERQLMILADVRSCWEEMVGEGFYTRDRESFYASMIKPVEGPTLDWAEDDDGTTD